MLANDLRSLIAFAAVMMALSAFFLCLVVLDLIGTAVLRLWLSASPGAARQARFRAALMAYRSRNRKHGRKRR